MAKMPKEVKVGPVVDEAAVMAQLVGAVANALETGEMALGARNRVDFYKYTNALVGVKLAKETPGGK